VKRKIHQIINSVPVSDGAGVALRRSIGIPQLDHLDPFLLLDEIKHEDPDETLPGFPDHPHRGFETVTYLIDGTFRHEDSKGHVGILTPGSVQWMTAGRGIIHSEMPIGFQGRFWGFQLWVNLPASHKMSDPRYQEINSDKIPIQKGSDQETKIIAGEYENYSGPVDTNIPIHYFDVKLEENVLWQTSVSPSMNALIYVLNGSLNVGNTEEGTVIKQANLGILSEGTEIQVKSGSKASRFLFLAAEPINEPVARAGPFVMNTMGELKKAIMDYESGILDK
jgi:redox-sensitive bicupin YhaK (pirin superfamily)